MADTVQGISVGTGGAAPGTPIHRFSHDAMGSIFEILIPGESADYARQAATAAFEELDRLYRELNRFTAASDVSQVNALGAGESVRVGLAAFECLQAAARAWAETGGAFDVTIGRLLALWRPKDGSAPHPTAEELAAALAATGMDLLELREDEHSVTVKAEGVRIDLGGIGKGYATDQMAALLKEWGIKAALVHGGQSSIIGMGAPPEREAWTLSLCDPDNEAASIGKVAVRDRAMSSSGVSPTYRHVIDPRTGLAVTANDGAWVLAESGTAAEALSTAFLLMAPAQVGQYCGQHPEVSCMLLRRLAGGRREFLKFGKW
jgi:thiamine biosynthesis lipoprotein